MLSLLLLVAFTLAFLVHSKLAQKGNPAKTREVSVTCEEPDVGKIPKLEGLEDVLGSDPTLMTSSFHLDIIPSSSPKCEKCGEGDGCEAERNELGSVLGQEAEKAVKEKRKKKKRAKKKRPGSNGEGEEDEAKEGLVKEEELASVYPFGASHSATQRRIRQHYGDLVRFHSSKSLTLAQVGRFVNCLIATRNELEHKSATIQRRLTITKALLCRADRSSLDRLRQQMCKLELEQKRLEEDAFVYNWLQQQLKLSPAYKKMIEITATKYKSGEVEDAEFTEITFEELLAQEKKDAFWQRFAKSKPCSG